MGTAAADFAKKARESDSPPHSTQGYFGGQSVKNGKGETTYTAPKNRKGCGSSENCRSRLSAPKAAAAPYLQDRTHKPFQQVSWLTHPQLSANVFSETSNDRFSPHAGTSALTVAVPLGSFTRFPILPQGLNSQGALKQLFTFVLILPQHLRIVNKQAGKDKRNHCRFRAKASRASRSLGTRSSRTASRISRRHSPMACPR